jgi:hypothetical protein
VALVNTLRALAATVKNFISVIVLKIIFENATRTLLSDDNAAKFDDKHSGRDSNYESSRSRNIH